MNQTGLFVTMDIKNQSQLSQIEEQELSQANMTYILDEFKSKLFIYHKLSNMILIGIYIPLFITALISNILVIIVVRRFRSLRNVTNYFLVNLSVADLLVTCICMPIAILKSIHSLWLYGEILCKTSHYLTGVAVGSSIFTITMSSIERLVSIKYPMSRSTLLTKKSVRKIILLLWFLALLIFSPILFIRKTTGFQFQNSEFLYCIEAWPNSDMRKLFGISCFILVFAIPSFIIFLAYSLMGLKLCSKKFFFANQSSQNQSQNVGGGFNEVSNKNGNHQQQDSFHSTQGFSSNARLLKERRRLARILLGVAVTFAICWLPFALVSLLRDLRSNQNDLTDDFEIPIEDSLLPFVNLMGHLNSLLNPILYCVLSRNFRRCLLHVLRNPFLPKSSTTHTHTYTAHSSSHQLQSYKMRVNFIKRDQTADGGVEISIQ